MDDEQIFITLFASVLGARSAAGFEQHDPYWKATTSYEIAAAALAVYKNGGKVPGAQPFQGPQQQPLHPSQQGVPHPQAQTLYGPSQGQQGQQGYPQGQPGRQLPAPPPVRQQPGVQGGGGGNFVTSGPVPPGMKRVQQQSQLGTFSFLVPEDAPDQGPEGQG